MSRAEYQRNKIAYHLQKLAYHLERLRDATPDAAEAQNASEPLATLLAGPANTPALAAPPPAALPPPAIAMPALAAKKRPRRRAAKWR